MSNLERLCLRAEQSFTAYPYLLPAFASLQTIKVLTIADVGVWSCEMVRTLQSELLIASILFQPTGPDVDPSESFVPSRHPLQLLQRSASTLRELMCGFWCDAYTESEGLLHAPETIYPEVRSLTLCNNVAPSPIPYIHALPNLTRLASESHRTIIGEYVQLGVSHAQRQMNIMLQKLALTDDGEGVVEFEDDEPGPLVWKDIQSYNGPLSDLWALGLTFPIPRLAVKDVPGVRTPRALTEVLASARPAHLMLVYEDQPFSSVLQSDFLDALRSEGAAGLRFLGLTIDVMAGDVDRDLDVGQALADIEAVMSGLQLRDVQLVLRDITPEEDPSFPVFNGLGDPHGHAHRQADTTTNQPTRPGIGDPAQGAPSLPTTMAAETLASLTLAERTLEEIDVQAFVRRLSASIPGLQDAIVSIGRPRRCGGTLRMACLGKNDDKVASHVYTAGKIRYREFKAADLEERGLAELRSGGVDVPNPGPSWASLSRAWYRGIRSAREGGLEGLVAGAAGAGVV
ncbi:hypothetical protein GSI_07755 [Ganoderma sinense ZZ0214-1]|uniref:Uncharacterized protein n=1 Tax=Ganoderma sinense ZZ0214-1 TaxID=1077348 RepID=A0A2G8S8W8_9APHY|nr:hypothetical protein GSI_07680 [Ganoderma sinense ZZ0214-1]PIL30177.1 hypothetical protein GSI_07755 [Ganoderma sinense ZZ0214-1]